MARSMKVTSGKTSTLSTTNINFFSPLNKTFYDEFEYQTLNPIEKEIRLLKLLPGSADENIQCELLPASALRSCQPYHAISYCAGDPTKTITIQVNGIDFRAFANLAHAFRRLRPSICINDRGSQPVLFWADQICINQSDPNERAHQVAFMCDIYAHAECVIVWLGDEEIYCKGIEIMKSLAEGIGKHIFLGAEGRSKLHHLLAAQTPAEQSHYLEDTLQHIEKGMFEDLGGALFRRWQSLSEDQIAQEWNALVLVFNNPWWRRGWIHQEIVLSRAALVYSCSYFIDWAILSLVNVHILGHFVLAEMGPHPTESGNALKMTEATKLMLKRSTPMTLMESRTLISMSSIQELKNRGGDLEELLKHSKTCLVSDPRDHVYAFLGLAATRYNIDVNYESSNTVARTFQMATKQIILCKNSLDVIRESNQKQRDPTLSSWVPDWSSPTNRREISFDFEECEGTRFIDQPRNAATVFNIQEKFCASKGIGAYAKFPLDSVLCIKALFIDQLAQEFTLAKPCNSPCDVDSTLNEWTTIADLSRQETYITGESLCGAFLRTLALGGSQSTDEEALEEPVLIRILMRNCIASGDWRFFRSPNGYMGVAPANACYKDQICVLLGASVPFILRKKDDHYIIVGEAYVHGFMYGRAMEMKSLQAHRINIH